jgi:hypothetical protein
MFRRALDVSVSVATIAAATAIIWAVLADRGKDARWWPWQAREPRAPTGYVRGDKIGGLPGLDFRLSSRTILVVFSSRCHFCKESMPYLQRLVSVRDQRRARVRIVAVGFEPDQDARQFPEQQGWHPDQIVLVPPSAIKIRGTPTVLLVNANATVTHSWLGRTSGETYEEIVKATFD